MLQVIAWVVIVVIFAHIFEKLSAVFSKHFAGAVLLLVAIGFAYYAYTHW